ncbi:hypothetical protein M231_01164, partial [Tremella mesenterica]
MSHDRSTTIGLESVPILSSQSNYFVWKLARENYLLIHGCLGIIEGTDVGPYRQPTIARTVQAGSVVPTAEETITHTSLDSDDEERWESWRKRELRAQGAIMSKVERGLLIDLRSLRTAYNMWKFLATDMQLQTPEHRTDVERKLRMLMLKSNPTDTEMTQHLQ